MKNQETAMTDHENVTVEGEATETLKLEIASFPESWEKLTHAAGLGADIILSGDIASRKRELALVAYNVLGFAAGQVLGASSEAVTTDEQEDWTDDRAGQELRLLSRRVPSPGANAITVPNFIKRQLVKWAVKKVMEFGEQFLAG